MSPMLGLFNGPEDHGPAQLAPPGGLEAYLGDLPFFFESI